MRSEIAAIQFVSQIKISRRQTSDCLTSAQYRSWPSSRWAESTCWELSSDDLAPWFSFKTPKSSFEIPGSYSEIASSRYCSISPPVACFAPHFWSALPAIGSQEFFGSRWSLISFRQVQLFCTVGAPSLVRTIRCMFDCVGSFIEASRSLHSVSLWRLLALQFLLLAPWFAPLWRQCLPRSFWFSGFARRSWHWGLPSLIRLIVFGCSLLRFEK